VVSLLEVDVVDPEELLDDEVDEPCDDEVSVVPLDDELSREPSGDASCEVRLEDTGEPLDEDEDAEEPLEDDVLALVPLDELSCDDAGGGDASCAATLAGHARCSLSRDDDDESVVPLDVLLEMLLDDDAGGGARRTVRFLGGPGFSSMPPMTRSSPKQIASASRLMSESCCVLASHLRTNRRHRARSVANGRVIHASTRSRRVDFQSSSVMGYVRDPYRPGFHGL
jgi:hypothetical protein